MLVLEEYEHAKARGAKIYCEVLGFGQSADAYNIVAPDPDGNGVILALKRALESAKIKPGDVDYINAHGTSTPLGDLAESQAIEKVFGEHAHLAVSSTKSMHGHALGAAGGLEGVATAARGVARHHAADDQLRIPRSRVHARLRSQRRAQGATSTWRFRNSFGFGGHNSVIVFGKVR